jgi:hypothetical protein
MKKNPDPGSGMFIPQHCTEVQNDLDNPEDGLDGEVAEDCPHGNLAVRPLPALPKVCISFILVDPDLNGSGTLRTFFYKFGDDSDHFITTLLLS